MNQLFIIGNGFDLAHDLKTSYKDFLLWYLNKIIDDIYENHYYDDPLVHFFVGVAPENRDSGFCKRFPNAVKPSIIKEPSQFLKDMDQFSDYLQIDKFFHEIINSTLWVDIELHYYKSLVNSMDAANKGYRIIDLHKAFKHIMSLLELYIEKVVRPEIFYQTRLQCIETIFQGKQGVKYTGTWMVLNFNYTNTIKLYDGMFPNTVEMRLLNIHGDLSTENPMIFGYGDEMDEMFPAIEKLNDNEYLRNMKTFGYFHTENYKKLIHFIKSGVRYDVHILGHSLGLSDRLLLNTILECERCNSIEIHYHHVSASADDFSHLVKNLSRHFNSGYKSKMRELVVPYQKCKPIDYMPN